MAVAAESAGFTPLTRDDGLLPPAAAPDTVGRIGAVERAAFVAASTAVVVGVAPVVPLTVARALWDGWMDGAASGSPGAFPPAAPGAVRRLSHRGRQFDVDLVPTLPRSAQGHPVIFQAGDSAERRDFAARDADVIFSAHGEDSDDALAFAEDVRARLAAAGRPEGDLRILPGTEIIIGATEEEAQEKKRWIRRQQVTPASALGIAGLLWNRDLSDRDVDGPLPKEDPVVVENDGSFGARPRRRSAQGGRRLAGEGRGGRLVAARDRHRARPAVRPCRHPPPASPTGSPPGCGTVPSTGSTSRRT